MSRPASDIDPKRAVIGPKRRRRKLRDRPEPLASQKAGEADALARVMELPVNPGVMLEPAPNGGWHYTAPHNDPSLWELEIAAALGTRSAAVVEVFLRDLKKLCAKDYDHDLQRWKADETELNAALGLVADIKPRNTQEAMLAAQMVAIHWMQMRLSSQALNTGGMIMEQDAALASKLARTYAQQLETLQTIRGRKKGTTHNITVTKTLRQEVHYHDHRRGNPNDSDGQAHERGEPEPARIIDQRPAVRRDDEGGNVLPMSRPARP